MCSAIDLACSSAMPVMPLLCGGVLVDSPFVVCHVIWLTSRLVPLSAGAFIVASPSPFAAWQVAPSSAPETEGRIRNVAARLTKTLHFVSTFLTD